MLPSQEGREIQQDVSNVLVRYATAIDRKDWRLFRTCFTKDCRADYGDVGVWDGVEAIVDFMAKAHPDTVRTLHRVTNVAVECEREGGSAVARAYVDVVYVVAATGGGVQATGIYDDELVRTAEGWRIARRRFTEVHRAPVAAPA